MSKQRIEIEVDVPEGFEATGDFRCPVGGEHYLSGRNVGWCERGFNVSPQCLILRRVEPKRESRWRRVPCIGCDEECYLHDTPKTGGSCGCLVERIGYENGRPVSVALESVEGKA